VSVTVRKHGTKWYVYVNHQGKRKAKSVGTSRHVAEQIRKAIEAKIMLGEFKLLAPDQQAPSFQAYSELWLKQYAEQECKPSTVRSYGQLLRVHVQPRFGAKPLSDIRREEVKAFIVELSQATKKANDCCVPKFSRNTIRLIVCALRVVLGAAVEDGLLSANPASKLGRYTKKAKPSREARAMTRDEVEKFLSAIDELHPDWKPFFLTAVRAGLRKGELIALQWGDIQFGENPYDSNRYLLVHRNWSHGSFTTPKNKEVSPGGSLARIARGSFETPRCPPTKSHDDGQDQHF